MKLFGSRLFGQPIKAAGVGAALLLSVSVSHSQSGPFAGFKGSWSGNGTVALSDGTAERIRCKASYNVNSTGLGLTAEEKQQVMFGRAETGTKTGTKAAVENV